MKRGTKKGAQSKKIIIISTIIVIGLIVFAISFFKSTGRLVTDITEEEVFEIKGGQITPEYVVLGIQDIGTQDYFINEIRIVNCGENAGGNITLNDGIKIFLVLCDPLLSEDTQFKEEATIIYSLYGGSDNKTQKVVLSGNVLSRKCIYDVYKESTPVVMNKCSNQTDCIQQIFRVRDWINEGRKANNQSLINSENVSVLDCSYV